MLEEAIFSEIKNDTTLKAKVLNGDNSLRVYPLQAPDGIAPSKMIVYFEVTQALNTPALRTSLFQISCIAPSFEDARGMAEDINRIFNDFSEGKLGNIVNVNYVKFNSRTSFFEKDTGLYTFVVELMIKY